jgi:hypothetical protein
MILSDNGSWVVSSSYRNKLRRFSTPTLSYAAGFIAFRLAGLEKTILFLLSRLTTIICQESKLLQVHTTLPFGGQLALQ